MKAKLLDHRSTSFWDRGMHSNIIENVFHSKPLKLRVETEKILQS
jgi:hypothetical protein